MTTELCDRCKTPGCREVEPDNDYFCQPVTLDLGDEADPVDLEAIHVATEVKPLFSFSEPSSHRICSCDACPPGVYCDYYGHPCVGCGSLMFAPAKSCWSCAAKARVQAAIGPEPFNVLAYDDLRDGFEVQHAIRYWEPDADW